ncbi:MAG: hypothetical protein H6Q68_1377 [Firmicutes bacterium]|nr:hypothetical protein [Bacillota bacterium]
MDNSEITSTDVLNKSQDLELASDFFKKLSHYMDQFDKSLKQEQEIGIKLVSFGQTIQFTVRNIGYYNPKLICFYGEMPDGSPVQLIQHVNQISFLLTAVQRKNPEKAKNPIGFCSDFYRHQEGYPAYSHFVTAKE